MAVLESTRLSPEQLAPRLGVASMTIRRWQKEPGNKKVPSAYQRTVIEGLYQLVIEGRLSSNSEAVQALLKQAPSLSFKAIIKDLGVDTDILNPKAQGSHQDKMMVVLSQIGVNEKHRSEVDQSAKKLSGFKKLGSEWRQRISTLTTVIRSRKLTALDKWVAYGALFYLITPFDLIPDHIPVIGLLDDFGILGFAVTYYLRRYPELFPKLSGGERA
ncbi:MAG: YkvA family protein [Oligoflexia bacterium]|nr:YkvA family protein [Oligoflexia bacterium]